MEEVYLRYTTSTGRELTRTFPVNSNTIHMDLVDIVDIDLYPLIWCTNLRYLTLRMNKLERVDLSPLSNCLELRGFKINYNSLQELDITPLGSCCKLQELSIHKNPNLTSLDLSPLFMCPDLEELEIDDSVTLTADLLLRSVGNWPDVLVKRFYRIKWTSPEGIAVEH